MYYFSCVTKKIPHNSSKLNKDIKVRSEIGISIVLFGQILYKRAYCFFIMKYDHVFLKIEIVLCHVHGIDTFNNMEIRHCFICMGHYLKDMHDIQFRLNNYLYTAIIPHYRAQAYIFIANDSAKIMLCLRFLLDSIYGVANKTAACTLHVYT